MEDLIRILHLEDDPLDMELIKHKLATEYANCDITWVNGKQPFEAALRQGSFDLVLSDFNLPDYDGMSAVKYIRKNYSNLPVIVISGQLGEEEAVECLKAGATDYVLKQRLQRLCAAVRRALTEKAEHMARREAEEELARQHKFLRQVIDLDHNFIFAKNYEGRFVLVNQALAEAYGISVEHLLDRTDADFNSNKDEVEQFRRHDLFVMDTLQEVFIPEEKITDATGKVRWLQTVKRPMLSGNGSANMVLGVSVDITERKKQEQRLARLNRVHAMLSGINSAITRIHDRDVLLHEACRIAVEEGGFKLSWCGFIDSEAMELTPLIWVGDDRGVLDGFRISLGNKPTKDGYVLDNTTDLNKPFAVNLREVSIYSHQGKTPRREDILLKSGFQSFASLPMTIDGHIVGAMQIYSEDADTFDHEEMALLETLADDISFALNYQEKQAALNYATLFDMLTGLPNRQLFLERAELEIQSNIRTNTMLALVLIDIRHFGMINDSFGKEAGDQLLKLITQQLIENEPAVLARIGGNIFAMVLSGLQNDAEIAHALQNYLVNPLGRQFSISDHKVNVTTRCGVALFPNDGIQIEVLVGNAEAALKKAKLSGEEYLFYTSDINAKVTEQLLLEDQLRRAIIEKQFVLYYQPKVATDNGHLVGFEALIRWISPERGFVPPFEFISILEETGMILEVGKWVTQQAATDYREWRKLGLNPPPIAVNVSAIQLRHPDFVKTIREASGFKGSGDIETKGKKSAKPDSIESIEEAAAIHLEITESVLMENIDYIIPSLQALKDEGFQISIDDFGTGYSSFNYLTKIPLNTIKIDRSFITGLNTHPGQKTIVSTIILLAHALKLKVIAEGVETIEQHEELRLMGCDELQGYLHGKPMPKSDVEVLLRRNRT
ncbi:MAG TPA: EAL domain-containing protein [Methylophilaceae bacterium]|jgi:diguanylate cyclase (GGDEF)-like protein/PAS domain S-box-containing protein